MPESKPRKPKSRAQQKRADRLANRTPLTHTQTPPTEHVYREAPKPEGRGVTREIPAEELYRPPSLPEPADYDAILVALHGLDPLAQELMIAQRLAAMPSQKDGSMPVNIPRMVRGPWAHNLRKLGIFCIPELATHELVAPDATGMLVNHTGAELGKIDRSDLWDRAKKANPSLGELVDNAHTPEEKRKAMAILAAKMPVEQRIAMERLISRSPEDLEPT